jgi:predicted SAM-dependent methyltransferase
VEAFAGKKVLHVGCGKSPLPAWFAGAIETRLDIDPIHGPDIVADMLDVEVACGDKYDVVFSNHALEHLYPQQVIEALEGFRGVLEDGGIVIAIVPNLKGIEATDKVVYEAPSGPVTGMDMIYGLVRVLDKMPYMAHHCGFVKESLERAYEVAGYKSCHVTEDTTFNLIAVGTT